eukprot:s2851_g2.t2
MGLKSQRQKQARKELKKTLRACEQCPHCKKKVPDLDAHIKTHHSFSCARCGMRFRDQQGWKHHMRDVHGLQEGQAAKEDRHTKLAKWVSGGKAGKRGKKAANEETDAPAPGLHRHICELCGAAVDLGVDLAAQGLSFKCAILGRACGQASSGGPREHWNVMGSSDSSEGNSSIVCQEGATANTTTTTTTSSAPDFILHTAGLSSCPTGTVPVLTVSRCEGAAAAPGFPFWPTEGCYLYAQGGNFYFNYNAGRGNGLAKRACEVGGGPSTTSTTTTNIGQGYILQAGGFTDCPADTGPILSVLGCSSWFGRDAETDPSHPKGCYMWLKTGNVYFNYHAGQGNIGRTMVCTISTPIASSGQDDAAFVAIWIGAGGVPVLLLALLIVWRCFRRARQTEPDVDGPSAVVIGGKATLRTDSKELVHPLNEMAMKSLPKYWTGCRESGSDEVNITTQDRLCPTGKHDKTKGGCPCVQLGGDPGLPTGSQIKRVIRVEDSAMLTRYIDSCDQIKTSCSSCETPDPEIFTRAAMEASHGLTDVLCDVDDSINEVYLWHGTQADDYALDEPGGHYDGVRAFLLCRVCLGNFYYTLDREPTAIDKYTNGECDSTIGDRAKAVKTCREMVVYDRDQVYPEYLVLYERLHRGETPQLPPQDVPFLLELPLYWRNVGRNPYTESFREHWMVKPMIRGPGEAHRCRYIDWKRDLGEQLRANGDLRCTPPNELDGNPDSGHALTATILSEFHGDEAISVENMAPGFHETLLWHGTSQQAAEAIAEIGFEVKKAAGGTHGCRFGHGYLAEDLSKSLSYCSARPVPVAAQQAPTMAVPADVAAMDVPIPSDDDDDL